MPLPTVMLMMKQPAPEISSLSPQRRGIGRPPPFFRPIPLKVKPVPERTEEVLARSTISMITGYTFGPSLPLRVKIVY